MGVKIGFEYIKYRWKAKGRHGIHSPFVYDFVDNCLKIKLDDQTKDNLKKLFTALKADHRTITINDFGAGSKKLSNQRSVSSIFKTSSSRGKYGKLLFQLAQHYKPQNSLEFGTSLGVGTTYLRYGNAESKITTIEACPNTQAIALENFEKMNLSGIKCVNSTFVEFLNGEKNPVFDLVFVDGHHDGGAILEYMELLKSITHNETIFVLDDIRWSSSMLTAWKKIIADPFYHVTLDFFRVGIAIPRKQQEKEHFDLKL